MIRSRAHLDSHVYTVKSMLGKIQVVIAEDEPAYRMALEKTLKLMPECELLGVCKDGKEALELCQRTPPDVLLTDLAMPHMGGIELMQKLLRKERNVFAVVLTTHDEDDTVFEALRAGALGYLLKTSTPQDVIEGIRLAAKGESKLTPRIAAKLLADFRRFETQDHTELYVLSNRENQILELIVEGARNKDIATQLGIKEKTVKNHVSNILKTLHVNSRTEAAMLAVRKK